MLTQLVFEHSLRIRLKAEASNEKTEDDTQDSASVVESTSVDTNSMAGETGSQSSQASSPIPREDSRGDSQSTSNGPVKAKDSSTLKSDTKSATKDKKEPQNLIGKINNLVTADLGNIVEGRDFLMISKYSTSILIWVRSLIIQQVLLVPLQGFLCTIFLYEVLGWRSAYLPTSNWKKVTSRCLSAISAFVGLATMAVLFPIPGYIAKKVRDVQVQRMKMVRSYPKCLLLFLTWHSFQIQDGRPSARCYRRYIAI